MSASHRQEHLLDEILVLRCQAGDAPAFERLAGRWQARLWQHALRLTGRREAASDVAQETWLAIAQGLGRLHDPAAFRGWAYRIVTLRAADWQRRSGREEAALPVNGTELAHVANNASSANHSSSDNGAVEALRAALRRLPRDRRALLSLRYFEDFDLAEIAEILGIPQGTVKSRLHHARSELRALIERQQP
jgi:RNA polymerase sigma-70 factor (ECF subfamily)